MIGSHTLTKAEADHMAHMEQLRTQGHIFFEIYFNGPVKRIHSLKNITIREDKDPQTGETRYTPVEGDRIVEPPDMKPDPNTGIYKALVYLDPEEYNLFWLSRNADSLQIEIPDEKIKRRVEALKSKEFKIPEGEKEILLIEKRRIERQLRQIEEKERKEKEKTEREKKKKLKTHEMKTEAIRPEPEKPDKPEKGFVKLEE